MYAMFLRRNYDAWCVDKRNFSASASVDEQIRFLLQYAVLAPSTVNTQPWRFVISGARLRVAPDLSRWLAATDPHRRDLYASIGCAMSFFIIAADAFGFDTTIRDATDAGHAAWDITMHRRPDGGIAGGAHLAWRMLERHMHRGPYDAAPLPPEAVAEILACGNTQARIIVVADDRRRGVADVVLNTGLCAMDDRRFRREISSYLKSNVTRSPVGIPGFAVGAGFLSSIALPAMMRRKNMARVFRDREKRMLTEATPAFGIIATDADTANDWMAAGMVFGRITLTAESLGIRIGVHSAAVEFGRAELIHAAGFSGLPQLCFRLGKAAHDRCRHTPRIPAHMLS